MNRIINYKIVRYAILGVLTASVEFIIFLLLIRFLHIYVAATISFLIGLTVSFIFNKFLVFKNSENIMMKETLKFLALGVFNSQISSSITMLLVSFIAPTPAKVLTIAVIAVWNFVIMNKIIFRNEK